MLFCVSTSVHYSYSSVKSLHYDWAHLFLRVCKWGFKSKGLLASQESKGFQWKWELMGSSQRPLQDPRSDLRMKKSTMAMAWVSPFWALATISVSVMETKVFHLPRPHQKLLPPKVRGHPEAVMALLSSPQGKCPPHFSVHQNHLWHFKTKSCFSGPLPGKTHYVLRTKPFLTITWWFWSCTLGNPVLSL